MQKSLAIVQGVKILDLPPPASLRVKSKEFWALVSERKLFDTR